MDFIEKAKGFLFEPSKTFNACKDESLNEAIKYYAIIALIFSAISALLFVIAFTLFGSMMGLGNLGMMFGAGAGIMSAVLIFVMLFVIFIIGAFIGGAILHIFVYIVGGRKGITQTLKALMYGGTPMLLFGWIPYIGFIASIWSLILEIIGIQKLQELTTIRAVIAVVVIPAIIAVILAILLAAFIAAFIFGMGGPRGY
ncbi:Yip1 domain protein [uncultured archaeon]|nr:Yip1 domain protein [uncultured archaeon]